MNLKIELPHALDLPPLRDHAERTLRFALTRFALAISEVRLRLVDENGPRGGADQRCRIQVNLRSGGVVNLEGVDCDPYAAIKRVAARVAHTVARRRAQARSAARG